jgi:hypothetical protein
VQNSIHDIALVFHFAYNRSSTVQSFIRIKRKKKRLHNKPNKIKKKNVNQIYFQIF